MLLAMHMLALAVACVIFGWMFFLHRRIGRREQIGGRNPLAHRPRSGGVERPLTWLAVRSAEPEAVRAALTGAGKFFVSPRMNGWVVVTGPDLPEPGDDVDACFHFLVALSRQLGHVQFFHAEKFSAHHAYARVDEGCVTRAYAWAGETVWNQGAKTTAEIALRMKCFDYGENAGFAADDGHAAVNVEKIPLLAARWSIDPAARRAGASSRF